MLIIYIVQMKKILFAFILNILLVFSAFSANEIPLNPKGHIHDYANKLTQLQKDTLNAMLKMYYERTTAKIAVIIEQDSDEDPFDRSLKYARTWKVGTKDSNNGLVFYINLNKRKTQVQVANKLQGNLPDGKVGEILRNYWVPSAKSENYYQGITNTVKAYMCVIEGKEPPPVILPDEKQITKEENGISIPFFIHVIALIIIAIQIYSLRYDLRGAKKLSKIEIGELVL